MTDIVGLWDSGRHIVDVVAARRLVESWTADPELVDRRVLARVIEHEGRELLACLLWDHAGRSRGLAVRALDGGALPADTFTPWPGLTMAAPVALKLMRDRDGAAAYVREHGAIVTSGIEQFLRWATWEKDNSRRPAVFGVAGRHWSPAFAQRLPSGVDVLLAGVDDDVIRRAFATRGDVRFKKGA